MSSIIYNILVYLLFSFVWCIVVFELWYRVNKFTIIERQYINPSQVVGGQSSLYFCNDILAKFFKIRLEQINKIPYLVIAFMAQRIERVKGLNKCIYLNNSSCIPKLQAVVRSAVGGERSCPIALSIPSANVVSRHDLGFQL